MESESTHYPMGSPIQLSDYSGEDSAKRNMKESSSAPRKSERAKKERNLDPDFIDSQAIIFLVEGDNEINVINNIPVTLPKGKRV
ncbi:hypothetical protein Tco_0286803 [Tanacetum coccineum]